MILYRHIRLDTMETFYVGVGNKESRAYSKYKRNNHWKGIVNKVRYEVEILHTDLTRQEAIIKEIELIKFYGRSDLGLGTLCNMTDGGEGTTGIIRPPQSEEQKRKHSKRMSGKSHPSFGAKRSDETKMKMRIAWLNKKARGYKGKGPAKKIKPIKNHISKIRKSKKIPVIQLTKTGEFIKRFDSAVDVKREHLNFCQSKICACCNNKIKSYKGFLWKYEKNMINP